MEFSYTAIVLKKRDIGETDRLYSFFTAEGGKVKAVARGVRKPSAKLAGQLETLTLASVSVMRSRGRGNVVGAVSESLFHRVRECEEALRTALLGVTVFDRLVEDHEVDRELFFLLLGFLRSLDIVSALPAETKVQEERRGEKIFLLSQGFLWKVLSRLGYGVELWQCAVGHEPLLAGDSLAFSPDAGGAVCGEHGSRARLRFPFSENAVKSLRIFLSHDLPLLPKLSLDAETKGMLRGALRGFLDWVR
ncbi:MAG: DNA repair protein RecO [Candidatus Moraniibacteriota bacterium]|nr:MAG: DNA repair protein RecO [Candidatus Moranbacteria bacterium]